MSLCSFPHLLCDVKVQEELVPHVVYAVVGLLQFFFIYLGISKKDISSHLSGDDHLLLQVSVQRRRTLLGTDIRGAGPARLTVVQTAHDFAQKIYF